MEQWGERLTEGTREKTSLEDVAARDGSDTTAAWHVATALCVEVG